MSRKTITEKYSSGEMSAFERKVYEYQEDVIQNLHEMYTKTILDLNNRVNCVCSKCGCTELLCGHNRRE